MTWDEFKNQRNTWWFNESQIVTDIKCPECGRDIILDNTVVLTSYPEQYSYYCQCGWHGCSFIRWTPKQI